jgi:hypothetical protein
VSVCVRAYERARAYVVCPILMCAQAREGRTYYRYAYLSLTINPYTLVPYFKRLRLDRVVDGPVSLQTSSASAAGALKAPRRRS